MTNAGRAGSVGSIATSSLCWAGASLFGHCDVPIDAKHPIVVRQFSGIPAAFIAARFDHRGCFNATARLIDDILNYAVADTPTCMLRVKIAEDEIPTPGKPQNMSYKQMKEEHVRKILRLPPQIRKELNEAFGLFLSGAEQRYPNKEDTPIIERDLFIGSIPSINLKTILRALGYEPQRKELKNLLMVVDSSETLDIFQFLLVMIRKMETRDTNEELLKAFRLFDKLDTGFIGPEELRALAAELSYTLSDSEIERMLFEADRDQDGKVNEEEFQRVMMKRK